MNYGKMAVGQVIKHKVTGSEFKVIDECFDAWMLNGSYENKQGEKDIYVSNKDAPLFDLVKDFDEA